MLSSAQSQEFVVQISHAALPGESAGPFVAVNAVFLSEKIPVQKQKRDLPKRRHIYLIHVQVRGTLQHDHTAYIFDIFQCRLQRRQSSLVNIGGPSLISGNCAQEERPRSTPSETLT